MLSIAGTIILVGSLHETTHSIKRLFTDEKCALGKPRKDLQFVQLDDYDL